jgi:hypothetical protein
VHERGPKPIRVGEPGPGVPADDGEGIGERDAGGRKLISDAEDEPALFVSGSR